MRINAIGNTATESDLVSGNYLALDGDSGTKKLPAEDIAKSKYGVDKIGALPEATDEDMTDETSDIVVKTSEGPKRYPANRIPTGGDIGEAVNQWLEYHPEATTTVEDGSLTESKFTDDLKRLTIKDYVTPEMFGAKGDGETDDTQAFEDALAVSDVLVLLNKEYLIGDVTISSYKKIIGLSIDESKIKIKAGASCIFNINDSRYFEIKNIQFVGGTKENPYGVGIFISGSSGQGYVSFCTMFYFDKAVNTNTGGLLWDSTFNNCRFNHCNYSVYLDCGGITFNHCYSSFAKTVGVRLYGARRVSFNHCLWEAENGTFVRCEQPNINVYFYECDFEVAELLTDSVLLNFESGSRVLLDGCIIRDIVAASGATGCAIIGMMDSYTNVRMKNTYYQGNDVPIFVKANFGSIEKRLYLDYASIPTSNFVLGGNAINLLKVFIDDLRSYSFDNLPSFDAKLAGAEVYVTDQKKKLLWNGTDWVEVFGKPTSWFDSVENKVSTTTYFGSDTSEARKRYFKVAQILNIPKGRRGTEILEIHSLGYANETRCTAIASINYARYSNGTLVCALKILWFDRTHSQQIYYELVYDGEDAFINIYLYGGTPQSNSIPNAGINLLSSDGRISVHTIENITDADFALKTTSAGTDIFSP